MLDGISFKRVLGLFTFALATAIVSSLLSYLFIFPRVQSEIENSEKTLALSQNTKTRSAVLGATLAKDGSDSGGSHSGDSSSGSTSSGSGTSAGTSGSSDSSSGSGSSSSTTTSSSGSSNSGSGSQTQQSANPTPTTKIEKTEIEKIEVPKTSEVENEKETETEDRLEVETASHEAKIDLKKTGIKIEIENETEGLKLKTKDETGTETELAGEAIDQINNEFEQETGVRVERTQDNKFIIRKGTVEAESSFPVAIDLSTRTLSIQTPSGEKILTVLPDQAVQNLINRNILDRVQTNQLTSQNQRVILAQLNDQPAFEVKGADDKKLFGFLPVTFIKTIFVSSQTGQVLKTQESFTDRFVEFFSF